MSKDSSDGPIVRHLLRSRTISAEQLESAQAEQVQLSKKGLTIAIVDLLIQRGILTTAILENIKESMRAAREIDVDALGSYKLTKKIGEGGMGAVYLAEDIAGRKVALKILPRKFAEDTELLSRFKRETRAIGQLNHENIVAAFGAGEDHGYHYLAMEYFEGEPLHEMLKRKKILPWDRAINYVHQVARGLKHAHDHGIIHRDIKPANIFILKNGVAKILDMGLSKNILKTNESFATMTGMALGTPHFISPEQAKDEVKIDGRTDIYSLGATLYNLVTGETPFSGSTAAAIMLKHLNEQLPNPQDLCDDIPDGVVQVIQKMMTKEPADRYPDCSVLLQDLELVLLGQAPQNATLGQGKSSVKMPAQKRGVRKTPQGLPAPRTPFYASVAVPIMALLAIAVWAAFWNTKQIPEKNPDEKATVVVVSPVPESTTKPNATVELPAPDVVDDSWIQSVQVLPPNQRFDKVVRKLKDLNPGFDIKSATHQDSGNTLEQMRLSAHLTNIKPLRALVGLKQLYFQSSKDYAELTDISPLQGFHLTHLSLQRTSVSDLTVLKDMPLEDLNIRSTKVISLAPLIDMPLKTLNISGNSEISDLPTLKYSYLTHLEMNNTKIKDLYPLKTQRQLAQLAMHFTLVNDLRPLNGMPLLTELIAHNTKIESLEPLRGMPLKKLDLHDCPTITSLAPLQGMPLELLNIRNCTGISSISPLQGMKSLTSLEIQNTKVTDLKALKSLPLKFIDCNFVPRRDDWILPGSESGIKTLELLNKKDVSGLFEKLKKLKNIPAVDDGGRWKNAIDLLPLINLKFDKVAGHNWEVTPEGWLVSDLSSCARCEFPYQPPEEYDLRVEFSRKEHTETNPPSGEIAILLTKSGKPFVWGLGFEENAWYSFSLKGADYDNPTGIKLNGCLELGRRYTTIISVRKNSVTAYLDKNPISEWRADFGILNMPGQYSLRDPRIIGLCSNMTKTIFHKVSILEIGGKGKFTRPGETAAFVAEKIDDASRWSKSVNLLSLIETDQDQLTGDWKVENNELISDDASPAKLELPYRPAGEYDFRIEFTTSATCQISHYGTRGGKAFSWMMGALGTGNKSWCAIEALNGRAAGENGNATNLQLKITNNVRHISILQVRNNNIRAYLDGKLMADLDPTTVQAIGISQAKGKLWSLKDEKKLALGTFSAPTRFHKIEVLEISGKGSITRPK